MISNYEICQRSGRRAKRDELVYEPLSNLWVIPEYLDPTHPQIFIRSVTDEPSRGSLRPEGVDTFVTSVAPEDL